MLDSKETKKLINREESRELKQLFENERENRQLYYDEAWV
jgi:hypothetical protein